MVLGAGAAITEKNHVQELTTNEQWESVLAASVEAPQWVFKHSTTCPISAGAYRQVGAYLDGRADSTPAHLVKVIESRPVSNAIASATGVTHQSPQMLLLKDGKAVWNASHGAITASALTQALQQHG
ncbi:MAG: bacillithiol system redox-active protein YtxJ [Candidatus Hydrogenedens sp.]|nr:bacillithiol system redox-active protein YtxJ [Candidatus Hydrogenedens sp.]